jgi:hypothetical protein
VGLKVLCAGCSNEEKERAESTVRHALGSRTSSGAWNVSLVKVGPQWSVTLDAPDSGLRAVTFTAAADRLPETIVKFVRDLGGGPAEPPPGPAEPLERHEGRWECASCHGAFVVLYEAVPGEGQANVAVACPHCWHVNRLPIGENAAAVQDYRAEKA